MTISYSIAELAAKHGIKPIKKLGQNFILDKNLCDKIVRASGNCVDKVILEIGPGPAGLTRSILKQNPSELVAVEMDQNLMPLLEEIKAHHSNLIIYNRNAKTIELKNFFKTKKIKIISNLPYNIGTYLLIGWFKEIEYVESMTLMLQEEVVQRIIAKPGNRNYGRLSILASLICDSRKCFDVSPKAFYPEPKVSSAIVHMIPKINVPNNDVMEKIAMITHHAFAGRRKMLRSSLKPIGKKILIVLESLNIDTTLRAENLTPEQYLSIAKKL